MKPLVSVIVPIYNVEKYLKNCVDSILNQKYDNLEVILVDDGSPDRCGVICDEVAIRDRRVKVIHKKNGGLSSARNAGMAIATADYWCFVDSDDWISYDMIDSMMRCFTDDIDLVCCGKVLSGFKEEKVLNIDTSICINSENAIEKAIFDKDVGIAAWGKIYRSRLFENTRFPEGEIHEDAAIMLQIFDKARKVFVLNRALYYYRYNSEGISKGAYSTKFDVVLKHNLKNEEFILNKYPMLKNKARAMLADGCYGMMLKILKTPKGFETYNRQFTDNKKFFIERIREFCTTCCENPKDYIWMLVILFCNRRTIRLLRISGVVQ